MMGTIDTEDMVIIYTDEEGNLCWSEPENTGWTK